jgi:hypothetical protein
MVLALATAVLLIITIPLIIVFAAGDSEENSGTPPVTLGSVTPTAGPTTAPPTPTDPAGFTSGQLGLLGELDRKVMVNCYPNPDAEHGAIDSSVYCSTDSGRDVAIYHFVDDAALAADTKNRVDSVVDEGRCSEGKTSARTWNYRKDGITQGTLICRYDEGRFVIYWTYDAARLAFIVLDPDAHALYEWWSGFEPVPR